jgi:hypothetical protein
MPKPSTLEVVLLYTLRGCAFLDGTPKVPVMASIEATPAQMQQALAGAGTGIVIEPKGLDDPNGNLPQANGTARWEVAVVQNESVANGAGGLHILDVALAVQNALRLQTPKDADGQPLSGGQWRVGACECAWRELNGGARVRVAVVPVSITLAEPSRMARAV